MIKVQKTVVISRPGDFTPIPLAFTEGTITALFERSLERHSDRVAVTSHRRQITYRELDSRANSLANTILSNCGKGKEPVVLFLGHDIEAIVGLLAVLKSGRPYLPLDASFPVSFRKNSRDLRPGAPCAVPYRSETPRNRQAGAPGSGCHPAADPE
jgi:non-ribosomal peptide synthetase component F